MFYNELSQYFVRNENNVAPKFYSYCIYILHNNPYMDINFSHWNKIFIQFCQAISWQIFIAERDQITAIDSQELCDCYNLFNSTANVHRC